MRRILVLVTALAMVVALAPPASAGGKGTMQLSALGLDLGECEGFSGTYDPNLNLDITIVGDPEAEWSLDGCLRQTFGPARNNGQPSGVYLERGEELFVGDLWYRGGIVASGTFATEYLFSSKWDPEIIVNGEFGTELFGRCQHPIVAGSSGNTGDFANVTGRLDFKDEPPNTGMFPMRGHLRNVMLDD
jgi:hypothetical protein